ncbi:hypothetical protein HPB49_006329 [Dermacentor silvarum]|uniref:Uncharacterized protein n=1 Tax=Dermacentor silvarum TaxID=543639 RepID=A0ACB8DWL7_DERSI|nr:hypothetical protein HPB49_006329 [Dermacentor silvarum]
MGDQLDGDSGFAPSGTPGCSRNMEALLQASRRLFLCDEEPPEAHQPASKNGKAGKRKRATKRLPPSRLRSSTSGPAKAQKRKGRKVAAASHDAAATPDAPVSHDLAPSQAVEIPNSSLVHGEIDSPPEQTQCDETVHTPSSPQHLDASVACAADEKSPQTRKARASCVLGPLVPLVEDAFPPLPPPPIQAALPLQPQRAANGSEAKRPQAERRNANRPVDSLAAAMTRPSGPALPREPAGAPPPPPKRNRRRGRRRQRFSRGRALLPLREPCDTILYRPLAGKANFLAHSQEAIAAQLSRVAGAHRVRVNFRLNIVAVDVAPDASLDPLLAVTAICDVPVRATTAPAESCTGYVFGVDPSINNDTLLANIVSDVAVLSCSRAGNNVILRFAGKNLPTERPVGFTGAASDAAANTPRLSAPLNKPSASTAAALTSRQSRAAPIGSMKGKLQRHLCPLNFLSPVAKQLTSFAPRDTLPHRGRHNTPPPVFRPTFNQGGATQAAGDHPTRPPVAGNTTTPAPRPPVTSPDSRDAVIALLSAALAYATEFLPQDCPARPLCAAALAAHRALANHGS